MTELDLLDEHTTITELMAKKAAVEAEINRHKKTVRAAMEAENTDVVEYHGKALFRLSMVSRKVRDLKALPPEVLDAITTEAVDIRFTVGTFPKGL